MTALEAVGLYTGLLGVMLTAIAMGVGRVRMSEKVSIGDGGSLPLIRAMRGMANFVEFVPMTVLVLLGMALLGAPAIAIHVLGVLLVIGRAAHGWHFIQADAPGWQRALGAGLSFLVLALGSIGLVFHAIF